MLYFVDDGVLVAETACQPRYAFDDAPTTGATWLLRRRHIFCTGRTWNASLPRCIGMQTKREYIFATNIQFYECVHYHCFSIRFAWIMRTELIKRTLYRFVYDVFCEQAAFYLHPKRCEYSSVERVRNARRRNIIPSYLLCSVSRTHWFKYYNSTRQLHVIS